MNSRPVFTSGCPFSFATAGQYYSASFHAVGSPPIHYSLSGPFWLHIDQFGTVSGVVPSFGFGGSFSYSVTAWNNFGSAHAGPCTVFIRQPFPRHFYANLSTYLSCTSRVFSGQHGTCTLYVTDHGGNTPSGVTASIALPPQLRADYCGYFFGFGCSISNNTASENLGTFFPGQTKSLTVTFTARTAFFLWGYHNRFSFTVKVTGSASSYGGFGFFGTSTSYSTAYVTIVPRFF